MHGPLPPSLRAFCAAVCTTFAASACGPAEVASPAPSAATAVAASLSRAEAPPSLPRGPEPAPGLTLPVTSDDPQWGSPLAPVTWVVFSDFQCPYCSRLVGTIDKVLAKYGPQQVRLVWKDYPLPFHPQAPAAHVAGAVIFRKLGSQAFWRFHDLAMAHQRDLSTENISAWAEQVGLPVGTLADEQEVDWAFDRLTASVALGRRVGVDGTPASFLNGILVGGAESERAFDAIIQDELEKVRALRQSGVPPERVYAARSELNLMASSPPPDAPAP